MPQTSCLVSRPIERQPRWGLDMPLEEITRLLQLDQALIVVSGSPHCGKTTLLGLLGDALRNSHRVLRLASPQDKQGIYTQIAAQLQVESPPHKLAELSALIGKHLAAASDKPIVLLCDDVNEYDDYTLEQLRQFSNLDTAGGQAISLVLCGTPILLDKFRNNSLRSLQQRITAQVDLMGPAVRRTLFHYGAWAFAWLVPIVLLTTYYWPFSPEHDNLHQAVKVGSQHNNFPLTPPSDLSGKNIDNPKLLLPSKGPEQPEKLEHIFETEQEALTAIQGNSP